MKTLTIRRISRARIPTPEGEFALSLYQTNQDEKEHLALTMGDLSRDDVLVRIHSECFTGDVLGSLRCDCGPQLREAMQRLAEHGHGVILYLRQEGRGIGLAEKLKAYNLQDDGYDTVEANLLLGHGADERDYSVGALILRELGVRRLRLLTNNPAKIEALEATGLTVTERVPLQTGIHRENEAYLQAKVERMRHLLNVRTALSNGHHDPLPARPRVTLSYAQSLDGSITVQRGESTAISGPDSMTMTHQLRAEHDAILVGIGTVLADDPQLTVRLAAGSNPQPIILDSALRFPAGARLLCHPSHAPWIVTTPRADAERQRELEAAGAVVIRVPAGRDGRVDLAALLAELGRRGVETLMVEGGAAVITSFLAARLVDRVVLTVAPIYIGGLNAVEDLVRVNGHLRPQLHNPTYRWAGRDLILSGDISWVDAVTLDDAGG